MLALARELIYSMKNLKKECFVIFVTSLHLYTSFLKLFEFFKH